MNDVFKPGHRIMVQIQSSLFPLYDRDPQTYVSNIFFAQPGDYRKATVSIDRGARQRQRGPAAYRPREHGRKLSGRLVDEPRRA